MAGSLQVNITDKFIKADSRNLPKVENVMILEFIATRHEYNVEEIRDAKILMSSRDSYLKSAIGYVEISRNGSNCLVKARIVPKRTISCKLYTVICNIDEENDVIIDSVCEDCSDSAGVCKHSLLLFFWLEKRWTELFPARIHCFWKNPSLNSVFTEHVSSKDIFTKAKKPKLDHKDTSILKGFQEDCARRQIKDSLILQFSSEH